MEKMNHTVAIKKLSDAEYVVLETGEIKPFEHTENRSEGLQSLYRTFKTLRYLINNNFVGNPNELFVTLTFAKNADGWRPSVNDTEYLRKCYKKFIRLIKKKYGKVEFIRVLEPHADGHAHFHALLRFDDYGKIFIANEELNELWGQGFVKVNSLKNVDNIGAYVSAYLADLDMTPQAVEMYKDLGRENEITDKKGKKFIKGGRMKYYPTGVQIYNKSKAIKMPERTVMKYQEAQKKAGSGKPTYEKEILIDSDEFSN
ncbi:rolling circle replication-associated protein, partial [Latilactobacillus sakei]|uniref:rolling circle replication-associated protein n=1 Tax=Latilactobacillus sakei TaxID=1599 RepID=UPI003F531240